MKYYHVAKVKVYGPEEKYTVENSTFFDDSFEFQAETLDMHHKSFISYKLYECCVNRFSS